LPIGIARSSGAGMEGEMIDGGARGVVSEGEAKADELFDMVDVGMSSSLRDWLLFSWW
jgi:hypothetical protein